jgi:hypothetical protein
MCDDPRRAGGVVDTMSLQLDPPHSAPADLAPALRIPRHPGTTAQTVVAVAIVPMVAVTLALSFSANHLQRPGRRRALLELSRRGLDGHRAALVAAAAPRAASARC